MVVFGATGFTGRTAVQEVARVAKKYGPLTWAVAGRSEKKLQDVLAEASKKTGKLLDCFFVLPAPLFLLVICQNLVEPAIYAVITLIDAESPSTG